MTPVFPNPRAETATSDGASLNSIKVSHDPQDGHFPAHLLNVSPHSLQAKTGFLEDFEGFFESDFAMAGI
jgi:hypothetical protein